MSEQHPSLVHFTDFGSSDRGDLIFNHFVWYSNSVLPFIDLFSRLYACPRKKLRREFRAVEVWRNKVAAHPSLVNSGRKRAIVCPACDSLIKPARSGDSEMVQTASVNQCITWSDGRFSVGREVFRSVDTGDSTPDDWGWELTDVHERVLSILKRYT